MKVVAYVFIKIFAFLLAAIGVLFLVAAFGLYWKNGEFNPALKFLLFISVLAIFYGIRISKLSGSNNEDRGKSLGKEGSNNDKDESAYSSKKLKKSEITKMATEMLSAGKAKSEVFENLSSGGSEDRYLANVVASHVDNFLVSCHANKINIAINLMFLQAVVAAIIGFNSAEKYSLVGKLAWVSFFSAIPLLFAWGFYKNKAGFYNAYILLSITQVPRALQSVHAEPLALVGVFLNLLMLAYVWYLRNRLFPDFVFITPKKVKGKYVFGS